MPTGAEIIERAGILLNDEEYVRWTLPELCTWLNEGVRAIILAKPSAKSGTRVLHLAAGTLQNVTAAAGAPAPLALLNITRNVVADVTPRVGGRIIRPITAGILDAQEPYWHDPSRVRFNKEVRHFIYDEQNPLGFYVYPGNTGAGLVEALLSELPDPVVASAAADDIASYAGDVGLPEPYSVPLLDYVLYRSQSKDDAGAAPGRAAMHYQQFATAIGLKIQVEGASSANARRPA